jgi:hypothetical protein
MFRWIAFLPIALLSACAGGCSMARALYVAVVHNSDAPPRKELARIDERERELARTLSSRRVLILPVAVLGGTVRYDTAAAAAIATQLRAKNLAIAMAGTDSLVLPFQRQPNEALTLWTRFKALSANITEHPRTGADYVVQVDVLGAPDRGSIGAVHVMAVTGKGEMAYRRLWNSHQALYKEIQPRSMEDAVRMVVTDLARNAGGVAN